MKSVQKIDLGLTGYDELFMNDTERKENKLPRIYDIPLSEIDDFPDHPFKVKLDEDMDQLVQSIKERGIITPVTLRPKEDGRYKIVSGHRRRKACELAGFETVKAEVREMTRDEAIILMVESNFQRSQILPSGKAFAYKMRLEAMKRQAGRPSKDNSAPVVQNFDGKTTREIVAAESGESHEQVRRYIRLTNLVPELLDLVDEGKIKMRPAVELSYLDEDSQRAVVDTECNVEESVMQRMDIERVRTALKMLTPEERAIIQDFFFTESPIPVKELVEKYAMPKTSIYRKRDDALKKLKKILGNA